MFGTLHPPVLSTLGLLVVSAIGIFVTTIVVVRIVGLRAFSKMSSFDFAVTVATGSIMASVAATSTSLAKGALAILVLYAMQWSVARLRRHVGFARVVDNQPRILMWNGEFCDENLTATRVTRADVIAKLREANVLQRSSIRAVVLESTGDVSVLHGEGPVDDLLLEGVRGVERASASDSDSY